MDDAIEFSYNTMCPPGLLISEQIVKPTQDLCPRPEQSMSEGLWWVWEVLSMTLNDLLFVLVRGNK